MLRVALLLLLSGLALAGQGQPTCDGTEEPCYEDRPWMRGTIEKSCAAPAEVEKLRKEFPNRTILDCHCRHVCDPADPNAGQTGGRKWDPLCAARCSPSNCQCRHVCDS